VYTNIDETLVNSLIGLLNCDLSLERVSSVCTYNTYFVIQWSM